MSLVNPIEELINYVIAHIHQGLLLNRLDSEQLQANISEGMYIVQDIQFNAKSINENLPYCPVHVASAKAARMNLVLPSLLKIFDQPVKIRLTDLEINLTSAKTSGFKVSIPSFEPLTQSDENPGLNLLTKSIGKFLSSINVEVLHLTINFSNANHVLQIMIPKLQYVENTGRKIFKIEGAWVTVDDDLQNKVCVIEDDIQGNFLMSSQGIEFNCEIEKLFMYFSYSQIKAVYEIFAGFGVSDLFTQNHSELLKALKEIERKVSLDQPIKTGKGRAILRKFDCIFISQRSVTNSIWDYNEAIHEDIKNPHFHISLAGLRYDINSISLLAIEDFFIDFYHFHSETLENSDDLYQSAQDSYFPDFFKLPLKFNTFCDNICVKRFLSLYRKNEQSALKISFKDENSEIYCAKVILRMNPIILKEFIFIAGTLNMQQGSSEASESQKLSFFTPGVLVEFAKEENECWCKPASYWILLEVEEISSASDKKIETVIDRLQITLKSPQFETKILEINKIIWQKIRRNLVEAAQKIEKSYFSYFDSAQGFILLSKKSANQSTHRAIEPILEEINEKGYEHQHEIIGKISITHSDVNFSPQIYKALKHVTSSIDKIGNFSSSPAKSASSAIKVILDVKSIHAHFADIELNLSDLSMCANEKELSCVINDLKLESNDSETFSTDDRCLEILYDYHKLDVKARKLVVACGVVEEIKSFFSGFEVEEQSSEEKTMPFKFHIEKCLLVYPIQEIVFTLSIDDTLLSSILFDFSCVQLFLGSCCVYLQNSPYDKSAHIASSELFLQNSCILSSISCVELKVSQYPSFPLEYCSQPGCCVQLFDDFYVSDNPDSENSSSISLNIGCIFLHICQDTLELLKTNFEKLEKPHESTGAKLNESLYFDMENSLKPKKLVHIHSTENSQLKEKALLSFSVTCSSFYANFYSGHEFRSTVRAKKSVNNRVTLKFFDFFTSYSYSTDNQWTLLASLKNCEVLNFLMFSEVKKILCKDVKSKEVKEMFVDVKVRGNNSLMLAQELDIIIDICSVKINLDTFLLQFCMEWSENSECCEENVELLKECEENSGFLKKLVINPVSLNIDYIQNMNSIAHLFKIEDFILILPKVEGADYENFEAAVEKTWNHWLDYLASHKFIAILSSLTPVVSISNIGSAMIGLLKRPFDSENIVEGTKQGLIDLVKVFSIESVKVVDSLLAALYGIFHTFRPFNRKSGVFLGKRVAQVVQFIHPNSKEIQENLSKFKK